MICWPTRKLKRIKEVHGFSGFFLSNSPMAKHKASTKLTSASRNLDSHSQFCLAGQGNKDDVCPVCFEKCAVGKCSAYIQACKIALPSLKFVVLEVSVFIEFSILTGENIAHMSERSK